MRPGKVEVQSIDYPELKTPQGKKIDHGVIIKPITTNICGSDQHMVRGRTTALAGLVLGHEITGEVIECGSGVEFIGKGDLVSVPFNVACGRCRNCKERRTDVCLNVNPSRAGGAYGYVESRRLDRRTSRIRDGAVRRLEPAQVPGQGSGAR